MDYDYDNLADQVLSSLKKDWTQPEYDSETKPWGHPDRGEYSMYELAKCTEPHSDGSQCLPEWDGSVYVCEYNCCDSKVVVLSSN